MIPSLVQRTSWSIRATFFPKPSLFAHNFSSDERRAPTPTQPKASPYGKKGVFPDFDKIVQRDRLLKETPENVKQIWSEYHKQFGKPHSVWTVAEYEKFSSRSRESPLFVYPLTRDNGFISIFQECRPPEIFFTTLEQYRRLGPYSLPLLRLRMYNEVATEKGLVLVRGELPHGYMGYTDAMYIIQALHWCYVSNESLYSYVWDFNHRPNQFNFAQFSRAIPRPPPTSPIIRPS